MAIYVVTRLVLLQLLFDQLHNNNTEFHGWVGGPSHYVVTPTQVEVVLGCDNYHLDIIKFPVSIAHVNLVFDHFIHKLLSEQLLWVCNHLVLPLLWL